MYVVNCARSGRAGDPVKFAPQKFNCPATAGNPRIKSRGRRASSGSEQSVRSNLFGHREHREPGPGTRYPGRGQRAAVLRQRCYDRGATTEVLEQIADDARPPVDLGADGLTPLTIGTDAADIFRSV